MPKVIVDGLEIEVEQGTTVLQACEIGGSEIPRFCYHERLAIAGNCRMCLVEIEKFPKPVASCAMPVNEGMIIHTNSDKVKQARAGVMEFLLINHPLDCPICDQGGECDLQDQAFKYGEGISEYDEGKRSVTNKYMGPLIKTQMNRCIHCTRCIRFATDVAGIEEIGAIGRGEHMEITSYLNRTVESELSGNVIDLCPVGALTSKPYAFKARSWELTKTESIDVVDALGSNIRIDSRGLEVMRILPKNNDYINEEWISDKARYSYDGLKRQRLDRPYIKQNGRLEEVSCQESLTMIAGIIRNLAGNQIAAIAGDLVDCETLLVMKSFLNELGSSDMDANQLNYQIDTSSRSNYLFNTSVKGINNADLCLLIGANVREAAPVLNARIGSLQRKNNLKVARIGEVDDQTYYINELGDDLQILQDILDGNHPFSQELNLAKFPMIIIGDSSYSRKDGMAIISLVHQIVEKFNLVRDDWNGFNILHNHASMVGSLDVGFYLENQNIYQKLQQKDHNIKLLFLLGADEIDLAKITGEVFIVYIGHHGDVSATNADAILPSAAYTEKDGIYVNLEGRAQSTRAAVSPPGQAREDWKIINDLANILELKNIFSSQKAIREELKSISPAFANLDNLIAYNSIKLLKTNQSISTVPLRKIALNYFMTDSISRASITMAKCTKARLDDKSLREVNA